MEILPRAPRQRNFRFGKYSISRTSQIDMVDIWPCVDEIHFSRWGYNIIEKTRLSINPWISQGELNFPLQEMSRDFRPVFSPFDCLLIHSFFCPLLSSCHDLSAIFAQKNLNVFDSQNGLFLLSSKTNLAWKKNSNTVQKCTFKSAKKWLFKLLVSCKTWFVFQD